MYYMEFGESILLEEAEEESLVVDFGSEIKGNIENRKKILLSPLNKKRKFKALMTHFHDDHVNGFINLANEKRRIFSKVYIPNVIETTNENEFSYIKIEIMLFILSNYKIGKGSLNLFEVIKAISVESEKIELLKRGDIFKIANKEYKVLWPSMGEIKFMKNITERNLVKFISEMSRQINDNIEKKIEEVEIGIEEILKNKFVEKEKIEELECKVKELKKHGEKVYSNGLIDKKGAKDDINTWIKMLKKNMNKISIVFQNEKNIEGKNILLTGDVDACRLKKIIKNKLKIKIEIYEKYNIIKAQHHGTKTYFIDDYPEVNEIWISNGKTSKGKRGKISNEYWKYISKGSKIVCTNRDMERCEMK